LRNNIHNTACIEGNVILGNNITIGAFTYIMGPVTIADDVIIGANCVIGTEAEHKQKPSNGSVYIGAHTHITDGVVIHKGTNDVQTTIGAHCFIMNQCYVAHDCNVADNVTLSAQVSLAGNVSLQKGCNLGMGVQVHQFVTVGSYAMIGMATPITNDVPPFATVYGNPARIHDVNNYMVTKLGLQVGDIYLKEGIPVTATDNVLFKHCWQLFINQAKRTIIKAF
jgi:UDP-N-acetylglucosamine acyltransferase